MIKGPWVCLSAFDLQCVGLLSGERIGGFVLAFLVLHAYALRWTSILEEMSIDETVQSRDEIS